MKKQCKLIYVTNRREENVARIMSGEKGTGKKLYEVKYWGNSSSYDAMDRDWETRKM